MREALRCLPVFVVKGGDMLKIYIINGKEWQYEEGEQPTKPAARLRTNEDAVGL